MHTKRKRKIKRNNKKRSYKRRNRKYKGGGKIPKIVHQIWIGENKRPDIWMETVKKFCNDFGYEYKLWDDTAVAGLNMVNKKYYDIMDKRYNGKSDILRYEILYNDGGIYIDADMVILNGEKLNTMINEITTDIAFVWEKEEQSFIASSIIFSTKNNPFIKECIDLIPNRDMSLSVNTAASVGPQLISDIYNMNKDKYDITLFPTKLFFPIYWVGNKNINIKTKEQYPDSVTFQYGYSTNNLVNLIK